MNHKTQLDPINHKSLNEAVYESILTAIGSGRLHPGTRLTLSVLAKQLGVSLMPVREALRRLQAENLVLMKDRRIYITEHSVEELREIYAIRVHLECFAVEKAVPNSTQETLRELEKLMDEMEKAKNIEKYFVDNKLFHFTIYHYARMPTLMGIIEDLWHTASPYQHIYMARIEDHKAASRTCHKAMLEGIRDKNSREVVNWLKRDLAASAESIFQLLAQESDVRNRNSK